VEDIDVYREKYMKYDCTLIGRVLVLSKLEEIAKVWATMLEECFKDEKCSYVDVAGAFDKRMGDVINFWRKHLHNAESDSWKTLKKNDDIVNIVIGQVTRFIKTFFAKEVELSAKCKAENDDIQELEDDEKHKKLIIDREVEAGGTITNAS
jgi:hypothetical protein